VPKNTNIGYCRQVIQERRKIIEQSKRTGKTINQKSTAEDFLFGEKKWLDFLDILLQTRVNECLLLTDVYL